MLTYLLLWTVDVLMFSKFTYSEWTVGTEVSYPFDFRQKLQCIKLMWYRFKQLATREKGKEAESGSKRKEQRRKLQ